jgi:hypothetical protein
MRTQWPLLVLLLCAAQQQRSPKTEDLVGRWELNAVTDRHGHVWPPAATRMTLLITHADSVGLVGNARIWADPNVPPEQRHCGALFGQRRDSTHLTLMFLVVGDTVPSMTMEAEVHLDSMFTQGRARDGTNVLTTGLWFVFVRASKEAHLGCLTSG